MELSQLNYFVQVAAHGSFSRAAAVLEVTQPFLSRQIRRLEVELHRHLFYRHGRGISLTDDGQNFLLIAKSVLHQLELATQVRAASETELTGRFVLGLTPSLARILTVPLVRAFTARFPMAQLSIVEGLSRSLHEMILVERVDAAVLHDQAPSSLINIEPVLVDTLCLIAPMGKSEGAEGGRTSITFDELATLPMIFPSAPHPLRSIVEAQATKAGVKLNVAHDIDGVETILELVQEGFGHTVASAIVLKAGHWSQTLSAIPVTEPAITTTLSLATSLRHRPTALHSITLDIIRELFGRLVPRGL
ncbi:MAG: LysR substrate-binding domain-containing protein [Pseudomonadota bacterium]